MAAACLAAGACAPQPGPPVALLRNPTAPIASQVDVAANELAKVWVVRQAFGGRWPAFQSQISIAAEAGGLRIAPPRIACASGGLCAAERDSPGPVDFAPGAPGRWIAVDRSAASRAGLPQEIWVFWMDFDRRTVALGDPDGRFVAILDQSATGGDDRITAARDILEWYGYDLSRVEGVR